MNLKRGVAALGIAVAPTLPWMLREAYGYGFVDQDAAVYNTDIERCATALGEISVDADAGVLPYECDGLERLFTKAKPAEDLPDETLYYYPSPEEFRDANLLTPEEITERRTRMKLAWRGVAGTVFLIGGGVKLYSIRRESKKQQKAAGTTSVN